MSTNKAQPLSGYFVPSIGYNDGEPFIEYDYLDDGEPPTSRHLVFAEDYESLAKENEMLWDDLVDARSAIVCAMVGIRDTQTEPDASPYCLVNANKKLLEADSAIMRIFARLAKETEPFGGGA